MILIPRTVSKTVKNEIGGDRFNEEQLIEKLVLKPKLLLQFFLQATQSRSFCVSHLEFSRKIFSVIFKKIISNEIPFDFALQSSSYLLKYNPSVLNLVSFSPEKRTYSGVVMLAAIPKIVNIMKESEINEKKLIAPFINPAEFKALYKTFHQNDFSFFNNATTSSLKSCLLQCREWEYHKGSVELQKVFIARIFNIVDAFEIYGFSSINQFNLLKHFCETLIRNWEWITASIEGVDIFHTFRALISLPCMDSLSISFTDLAKQSDSIEKYYKFVPDALYQRLDVGIIAKFMYAVSLKRANPPQFISAAQSAKRREKVDFNDLKHITFDRGSSLSDDFILGFCAFFPKIIEICFREGGAIEHDFLIDLSRLLPKLKTFVVYEMKVLDKKFFEAVSSAFPMLEQFSIACIKKIHSFEALNMPNLIRLTIEQCEKIEYERDPHFPNLRELKLQGISWIAIQSFIKTCPDIEELTLKEVEGFDLRHYPHPSHLLDLIIDCKLLENSLDREGSLSALGLYINLKSLEIVGMPSMALVSALEPFNNKIEIKIISINKAFQV